ncbi:MAG: metallophosphoesterase [Cyanobacteria bacterium]|nr:metallophosphoesterase [Cyanobacteriota bacterium]
MTRQLNLILVCALSLFMSLAVLGFLRAQEPTQASPLRWVAMGDFGSGMQAQQKVADRLWETYQHTPYQFMLSLGDNIYPIGNIKKLASDRIETPYAPLWAKGVGFYPVLGNHDVIAGFGPAQMAYFKMPGRYYTFSKGQDPARVEFFALDTNTFHHDRQQQQWLRHALAESHARWKVVYAHHPVYSSGKHGSSKALSETLKPILEAAHVSLYLCGHDHDYERFQPVNHVEYIVSGGGGASLRQFDSPEPGSERRLSKHHFLLLSATAQSLTIEAIGVDGALLDSVILQ